MPLELNVKTKDKTATYTRDQVPMLENLLDALEVQRLEIEMFSKADHQPTAKENKARIDALAKFAAKFWGHGLTQNDVLSGVSSVEGLAQIEKAVATTLGMDLSASDEEDEPDKDPKK